MTEVNSEENLDEPNGILEILLDKNGGDPPLDFEEFKDQIDTRGGYVQTLALSICDFHDEIDREEALQAKFAQGIKEKIDKDKDDLECSKEQKDFLRTFVVAPLIPDLKDRYTELLAEDKYPEEGCSFVGKSQDEWLPLVFASPVQSGFLPQKWANVDRNRSRINPDIAGTEPDHLGPVFCSPWN